MCGGRHLEIAKRRPAVPSSTSMKHWMGLVLCLVSAGAAAQSPGGTSSGAPRNDLPQPYRTARDWGQLPPGVKWAAVTAVEPAPDGTIYVVHRCFANSCEGRPEAPILVYDTSGRLLRTLGAGLFVFPHGATVDRDSNLWVTDARGERQGASGLQVQSRRHGADDARQGGVSASGADCFDQPTDVRRRAERRHLRRPTVIATARTTASSGSRRTGSSSRSGERRARVPARSANRTPSPWIRAGGCSSVIARTTASRSSIRTASTSRSGASSAGRAASPSPRDDTIYVTDSESGPDTGAHELTGIKKGIRIGSAQRRLGHRVHRGHGIHTRRSLGSGRRWRRRGGQCLWRRRAPPDAGAPHEALRVEGDQMHRSKMARALWGVVAMLATVSQGVAQTTTTDSGNGRIWVAAPAHTRSSPLNQINASNFDKLKVAWCFAATISAPASSSRRGPHQSTWMASSTR